MIEDGGTVQGVFVPDGIRPPRLPSGLKDPQSRTGRCLDRCLRRRKRSASCPSSTHAATHLFSHVDVAGVGGEQAVASVGTPHAIGLPVAPERPRARGRMQLASTDSCIQTTHSLATSAQLWPPSSSPTAPAGWARSAIQWQWSTSAASRHPERAGGRRVGNACDPAREHQPHLHHDRRARV
jgi:hypothetical protein